MTPTPFSTDESCARELDAGDPLAACRDEFHIPRRADGRDVVHLAGNSLGLMPRAARELVAEELDDWARLGVEGHFAGRRPWYSYHELLRGTGARLVGARPGEVVMMNSLTVNLHLMMVTFFRPTRERFRVLMEERAFPSDNYAVRTHLSHHGLNPDEALLIARPREGEDLLRTEDVEALIERERHRLALVMLGGVHYATGQVLDMARIASAARRCDCAVGFDLAHAAGNVPLSLHGWDVDFAVWCNYKYLNGGPGAVGACFVHEKHGHDTSLPRFGGWWGNDPKTRFERYLDPLFIPQRGAAGWQISNPPILSLAPVKASYDIFDRVGMTALREKSVRLTAYLEFLLDAPAGDSVEIITPRDPQQRGCQLSIRVRERPRELVESLNREGVICDFREPDVIRAAPVPLYNSFHDVWSFAQVLSRHARKVR